MPKRRKGRKATSQASAVGRPIVADKGPTQNEDKVSEATEAPVNSHPLPGPSVEGGASGHQSGNKVSDNMSSNLKKPNIENRTNASTKEYFPAADQEHIQEESLATTKQKRLIDNDDAFAEATGLSLNLEAKKFAMASRKPKGTLGENINLIANYFVLKYNDTPIYHYDVDIIPIKTVKGKYSFKEASLLAEGVTAKEAIKGRVSHVEHQQNRTPGKQRCQRVIAEMFKDYRLEDYNPAYDRQKNLYTTKMLPLKDKTLQMSKYKIRLEEEEGTKEYEIVIKPVRKRGGGNRINLEPLNPGLYERHGNDIEGSEEAIMALDTIMSHRLPSFPQVQVGRAFFMLDGLRDILGDGLEIWYGYNQSVHLTQKGPAVIVNFAAKAFHTPGPVIAYASKILSTKKIVVDVTKIPKLNFQQIKTIEKNLTKVKVEVTHLPYPRKFEVQKVTKTSANETFFPTSNNTQMSVAEYFRQKYRQLRYPNLPCLQMKTTSKKTFIPMEACRIISQPKLGELSKEVTSSMISKTAIRPVERFKEIRNDAELIQRVSGQTMEGYDLFMELKFMELQGRILEPPKLAYRPTIKGPAVASVNQGTWKMDGKQFFRSMSKPCSWILLSFSSDKYCTMDHLNRFADTLCDCASKAGMNLADPKEKNIHCGYEKTIEVLKYAKKCNVAFAVVILSSRDKNPSYEEVKYLAEIQFGLLTQCMKDQIIVEKCKKPFDRQQVAANVLLKINSKLGGINHTLSQRPVIFSKPIIVFGADAAHSPRGHRCPSIAAVVGSLDAFPFRYATTCRVQQNPDTSKLSQEIILELEDMVKEILQAFLINTNGKCPEKIIFFRDGVSEGQFSTVLQTEVNAVQRACVAQLNGFLPPITFIIVQKRHQTRFRPSNPRDPRIHKSGNVPPGTTVDTDVVHPKFFDFFLCSHVGIQGTSKPAHYTVLYDENDFSSDELQKLCYHLCHMYVRCNRSISVPAPVKYADLACTRAKKYADWCLEEHADSVSSASSDGIQRLPDGMVDVITGMKNFASGMFYV